MKARCTNPKSKDYKNYGARGITFCKQWENYHTFKKWAFKSGYADTLTLERKDVLKGYSPKNCRWITAKEQARNTTRTVYIKFKGKLRCLIELAEEAGVDPFKVWNRFKRLGIQDIELLLSVENVAKVKRDKVIRECIQCKSTHKFRIQSRLCENCYRRKIRKK